MAAGSLCGIVITPQLVSSPADEEATPVRLPATAAAFNCSLNAGDVRCVVGSNGSTLYTTTDAAALSTAFITSVEELVNQV